MDRLCNCFFVFLFTISLLAHPAQAGQFCNEATPTAEAVKKGLQLALKTQQVLAASGAQVALLGRVGSDLSKYGLRYSHAGFAWRDHAEGRWLVEHELNQCATASSDLFEEGLGNFFLDSPFAYEAVLLIPSHPMQENLARILSTDIPRRLHHPAYSMIANPWATSYQNSNQWMLEVIAAAVASTGTVNTRAQAQRWLRENDFAPSVVHLSPFTRLGARLFSANVQFDDHSLADRIAGQYQVVTVEAVNTFVARFDPQSVQHIVTLDESHKGGEQTQD